MKSSVWKRAVLTVAVIAALPALGTAADGGGSVFKGETRDAEVWVGVDLARHRAGEAYIPLTVVIRNRAAAPVKLDRGSFNLVGADTRVGAMPSFEKLRAEYPRLEADAGLSRVYGLTGIPVGTRLDIDRFVPSSFFPSVRSGEVRFDSVEIPGQGWTVDVLYLPKPAGFEAGTPATLRISGEGWSQPVEVSFHI